MWKREEEKPTKSVDLHYTYIKSWAIGTVNPYFKVATFFRLQNMSSAKCWLNVNLQAMKVFPITRKKILEAFEVTRRSCKQDRNGSWGIDNLEHLRSNKAQVVISNKRSKKNSGINEFFIIFLVTTNNK